MRRLGVLVAVLLIGAVGALLPFPAAAVGDVTGVLDREPNPQVTGPVTGGRFDAPFTASPVPLQPAGYLEQEFFLTGAAKGYVQAGTWGSDGRWAVRAAEQAPYRTRMLVRRPIDPARFNGTVVVEWLNVSAGVDIDPDYLYDNQELLRAGYAWVGVSAQAQGVAALRAVDPARYGSLSHPGDTFSYSIFSQAAQALAHPAGIDPLAGLQPRALIADGESQSAGRAVTYANAVQPVDRLFAGFLIHSRGGASAPISQPPQADQPSPPDVLSRTDLRAPALTVQTESDLFAPVGYYPVTQPDGPRFRLWEVPGTAHVDATVLRLGAQEVERFIPAPPKPQCGYPPNDGQERYVMDAALARLNAWVRDGLAVPYAPRIAIAGPSPSIRRDRYGNALGGIRTPALQAPIATLTGTGNSGDGWECLLMGTTTAFAPQLLRMLYPTHASYLAQVGRATGADLLSGLLLPDDALRILRTAGQAPIPPS